MLLLKRGHWVGWVGPELARLVCIGLLSFLDLFLFHKVQLLPLRRCRGEMLVFGSFCVKRSTTTGKASVIVCHFGVVHRDGLAFFGGFRCESKRGLLRDTLEGLVVAGAFPGVAGMFS